MGAPTAPTAAPESAPSTPPRHLVYGALAGVALSNAFYNILTKHAITSDHKADPLVFSLCRDIAAWPLLQGSAWLLDGIQKPRLRDVPLIMLLGFLGVFANQFLFLWGMAGKHVTATEASVLDQLKPIFAVLLAIAAKQTRPSWMLFAGVLLTFAGAVVMAQIWTIFSASSSASSSALHLLSIVGAAFVMALYYVVQKPVLGRYPALSLTAWSYFFGAVWMALASLFYLGLPAEELRQKWASLDSLPNLLTLLFAVLINSCLKYALQSLANKWAGATTLAAWSCVTPIVTGVVGALVPAFHEPLTWAYFGALPVIVGVLLVSWARERETASASKVTLQTPLADADGAA